MDPTTMAQQPRGEMGGIDEMMSSCPMHKMMGSPMGWVFVIATAILTPAAIAALVSLSIFLIRRSRPAVAP